MPVLVAAIQQQLIQKQDMRKCAEILGSILTSLHTKTAVSLLQALCNSITRKCSSLAGCFLKRAKLLVQDKYR